MSSEAQYEGIDIGVISKQPGPIKTKTVLPSSKHQKKWNEPMPKNVILAASLPAPAEILFDMYLDPSAHAAFTGAPVSIDPTPGTAFRAFDGILTGTMLHVEPKRLIVQTWRSGNWPSEAIDSILTLTFWPEGDSGRIELVHTNVADEDFAGVSQGWEKYYWNPWRAHLTE